MASQAAPDTIVVHYTATYTDKPVTVATIRQWHLARGWKDIGYHWVIYPDGSIHKGRDESVVGAHVANQNTGKIGVCYVGGLIPGGDGHGHDTRTPKQHASMITLIREIMQRHPTIKRVVGHRDLAATECPGFDVQPWWASVQQGTVRPPPTTDPPFSLPPEPSQPAQKAGFFMRIIEAIVAWLKGSGAGKKGAGEPR